MNGKTLRLANKYAQAFLNWQGDRFSEADFWNCLKARQFLVDHGVVLNYLNWPSEGLREKLSQIFLEKFNLPSSYAQLLKILYQHRRMILLQEVLHCLIEQYQFRNQVACFQIESYPALTETQLADFVQYLEVRVGLKILYHTKVNPELLAGLRASSIQWLWEDSISGKLRALQTELIR
jgi:F0F1-type ATP synthase delta subunit